ncbi:hypothetical protein [Desertivirga brevis]|uniref:hypothetical protein n=1 Tax=Desertivirga brevis TaxID=2810310 RepID=UPI001A963620|nr:hypothetical protein [Pedobacter sp. SYSU D00873]
MKKLLLLFSLTALLSVTGAKAQDYKTAVGLSIDFGTGATLVGPSIKHFFNPADAVNAEIIFGGNSTLIQGFYQHHWPLKDAQGLKFYLGGGPGVNLYEGGSTFILRPMAGLEYKIKDAPIALNFDWRPGLFLYDGGSEFEAGRFGIGIKYTLK